MKKLLTIISIFISSLCWANDADINDKLIEAARKGDIAHIEKLLSAGADINHKNEHGLTVLNRVAVLWNSDIETIKYLIKSGANVKTIDNSGHTVLHFIKTPGITKLLIENGADPTITDFDGGTPLETLIYRSVSNPKNPRVAKIAKELISGGADVNAGTGDAGVLSAAITYSNKDVVKLLVDSGLDITSSIGGVSPIIYSLLFAKKDITLVLIKAGFDVNAHNDELKIAGITLGSLEIALAVGDFETASALIGAGAEIYRTVLLILFILLILLYVASVIYRSFRLIRKKFRPALKVTD